MNRSPLLITAARDGHLSLVQRYVSQGHSLDERDKDGATALFWASCRGHEDVCKYLLEAGSDVNASNKWGATPVFAAVDNNRASCLKILLDSQGVDVNKQNERGDTTLHMAAYRGHLEILCMLTAAKADPFLTNGHRITPAQEAYARGKKECAQHLLQYMRTYGVSNFSSLPTEAQRTQPTALSEINENEPTSWPMEKISCCKSHLPRVSSVGSQFTPSSQNIDDRKNGKNKPQEYRRTFSCNNSSNSSVMDCLNETTPALFQEVSGHGNQGWGGRTTSSTRSEQTSNDSNPTSISDVTSDNYPYSSVTHSSESFSELGDQHDSNDGLSFESLLSNCLPVDALQGSPNLPEKIRINTYSPANNQGERKTGTQNHHQQRESQDSLSPPELPPRSGRYASQRDRERKDSPTESDEQSFDRPPRPPRPPMNIDNSHNIRNNEIDAPSGFHMLKFVEQLQKNISELQERLLRSEASNAHLNDVVLQLQQENKALKDRNDDLMGMVSTRSPRLRYLQARGPDWNPNS